MSVSIGRERAPGLRLRSTAANLGVWLSLIGRPRRFKATRLLPPTARLALGACAGLILVAAAMYFADGRSFVLVQAFPVWLVDTFNEITDFGLSGWFLIPIAGFILLAAVLSTAAAGHAANLVLLSLIVRLSYVFVAIAVPGLVVTIVKRLIGRVRPSEAGPFAYMPWSWRAEYASLPSGHTTTAFAAAVAIGVIWPAMRVPMAIYAMLIAASRVIIQAHFVSDVIAAAFVGVLGAIVVRNWFAARRLAFVPGTDGAVHALPGPSWRRVKAVARRLIGQ